MNGMCRTTIYSSARHGNPTPKKCSRRWAIPAHFQEIVFCGLGEPTLRLDTLLAVGRALRRQGARVRLNTNGLANQYHGRDVTPELGSAIDAMSISLNAQDEATLRALLPPRTGRRLSGPAGFHRQSAEPIYRRHRHRHRRSGRRRYRRLRPYRCRTGREIPRPSTGSDRL